MTAVHRKRITPQTQPADTYRAIRDAEEIAVIRSRLAGKTWIHPVTLKEEVMPVRVRRGYEARLAELVARNPEEKSA
jgi:hypothetical protein